MLELIRALGQRANGLRRSVKSLDSPQVRRASDRDEARAIVDSYFRELREQLRIGGLRGDVIQALDEAMHALLETSRKLSAKGTYENVLKSVGATIAIAEKLALSTQSLSASRPFEPTDASIVRTLARVLPSAARAYEQALRDLAGPERLSWRGPATDLRESLRETLDHLAPDADVASEKGFKLEKDQRGPTMKQKVRYILRKRGISNSLSMTPEQSVEAVDEIVGGFVRSVYTRSSISTHTPTERSEVLRIHTYVRAALCELLEIHPGA